MLLVKCPRCGNEQKYDPGPGEITTKSKRCVYCGRSFKVHPDQERSCIVRRL